MAVFARDVMTAPVFIVSPSDTIAHVRNLMVKHRISRVLVMDEGKLTGILTKKDIAYRLRQRGAAWRHRSPDQIKVSGLATGDPVVVAPDTGLGAVAQIFVAKNISCVPVMENGSVAGIVTKSDLMRSTLIASLGGTADDVMEDVATVNRFHSIAHVITVMSGRNDKVVVMNNDGTIAGIITETNLAFYDDEKKIAGGMDKDVRIRRREKADGTRGLSSLMVAAVAAEDVMTSPVITVAPGCSLVDAVALMGGKHINSLVVVENGTPAGIVKRDDIIKEVAK
jgi:CBS domain-containing protein